MNVRLRKVTDEDAAQLCALWGGSDPLPGYCLPGNEEDTAKQINEWNRGEANGACFEMLLIEADGSPAGLVSLYEREEGISLGISVHPSCQRRGIGGQAVGLAAERARACGYKSLISQCREDNKASIALHEKCGFELKGKYVNSKGRTALCWRMKL